NAKIDIQKEGIKIYGDFVPFCKGPDNSDSEAELSKSDLTEHRKRVKKLEQTVDWIRNYVKEQTGLEPGKELKDSSSSKTSSDEKAYTIEKEPRESAQRGSVFTPFNKVIYVKKKSVNKKVQDRRLTSAVPKVRMESEHQAERIPEGPSEKDLSNNLSSDLEELTKESTNKITLNCIIVPIGPLHGLQLGEVTPVVTVNKNQIVSVLEVTIQSTLQAPFNSVRLKLFQTPDEMCMQLQDLVSSFFNTQHQLEHYHIIVHPL
ncbi:hypothetical protein RclHR1_38290001, partial [Rhizophagus clarus]